MKRRPLRAEDPVRSRASRLRLFLGLPVVAMSVAAVVWSCSSASNVPSDTAAVQTKVPVWSAPDCSASNAGGCPCTQPGETIKCGEVAYKSESYLTCSIGLNTCKADGSWSGCQGTQVVTLSNWELSGLRLQSIPELGAPISANDVCDPNLYQIPSVLGAVDGAVDDGAITINDSGGVTLTYYGNGSGPPATTCGDAAVPPLAVNPATTDLQITSLPLDGGPISPNTVQFSASSSGCAGDAGVNAIWSVDQPGYATVSEGGLLTVIYPYIGPIHVTAYAGTTSGVGTANVTLNVVDTSQVSDGGGLQNIFSNSCWDAGGGG